MTPLTTESRGEGSEQSLDEFVQVITVFQNNANTIVFLISKKWNPQLMKIRLNTLTNFDKTDDETEFIPSPERTNQIKHGIRQIKNWRRRRSSSGLILPRDHQDLKEGTFQRPSSTAPPKALVQLKKPEHIRLVESRMERLFSSTLTLFSKISGRGVRSGCGF